MILHGTVHSVGATVYGGLAMIAVGFLVLFAVPRMFLGAENAQSK